MFLSTKHLCFVYEIEISAIGCRAQKRRQAFYFAILIESFEVKLSKDSSPFLGL